MNERETERRETYFFYGPEDFTNEQPGIVKPERRRREKGVPERIEPPVPLRQPEPQPTEPERVPEKAPERETVEV